MTVDMNSFLWIMLLPVVFMLHEFEEIIMFPSWTRKNEQILSNKFPVLRNKIPFLKTEAFSMVVFEEFIIVSICSVLSLVSGEMIYYYIVLLAFSLHLIVHVIQFLILRKYIPSIITAILCMPYCVKAIGDNSVYYSLSMNIVIGLFGIMIGFINLIIMQKVACKITNRMMR